MSAAENAAMLVALALSSGSALVCAFGFLFVAFAFASWFRRIMNEADKIALERARHKS